MHRRRSSTGTKTSACRRSHTTTTADACRTPGGRGSRPRRPRRWAHFVAIPMSMGGYFVLSLLIAVVVAWLPARVEAQDAEELFRKVNSSVLVIRAKGRDVGPRGLFTFSEIGSGVLISADGKVMTAAHVVHAMDEIFVESIGGETVPARVIASEPAADLSLLQLARVPKGAQAAPLGDSDRVRVGQQVLVI